MPGAPDLPEDLLIAWARLRGLSLDAERAAALRPLAESLFARLAILAGALPRTAEPPPSGVPEERAP